MIAQRLLIAGLALAGVAFGGDREFDQVVKAIETHYGTHRTHIPLMGVANLFMKTARPEGVSGFKVAIFEDLATPSDDDAQVDREKFMDSLTGGGLQRLVRVKSRGDGEATYIFASGAGKSTRMLIATFEPSEATVVEVKVETSALVRMLGNPARMGGEISGQEK